MAQTPRVGRPALRRSRANLRIEALEERRLMAVTWHRFPIAQSLIEATPAATPALQTPTTTTVGAYPTFVPPGQPIVLTAEVKAQGTGGAPTGTVTFSVDGVPEAPVPLFFEGVDFAGLTLPSLPEGTHQITAQYNGDTTFASSTSAVSTQVIVSIAARSITTTTVSAAPNPATTNLRVFLTANITSTPPPAPAIAGQAATPATGLVTFFVDGTQVASTPLQLINVGTGLAQAILPALPAGTHQIVASYSGDSTLTPSTSAPFVETVVAVPPPEGPRVTSLRRYGFHAQPTSLVIGFDGPLDAFSAEDKANYLLAGPVTPRGRAAQVDPVIAALYDATANTVTLRLRDRLNLHLRYHLTIVGTPPDGVSNPSAIFLDGAGTGHPGTNFETTFGGAILAGPASALGHGTPARSGRWHARA